MTFFMRFLLSVLLICILNFPVFGQIYSVSTGVTDLFDKSKERITQPANIEQAQLTIKPRGIYTEVEIELTFAVEQVPFNRTDSFALNYYFELPLTSIINEAWLWIDGEPRKASTIDPYWAAKGYDEIKDELDPDFIRADPFMMFWGAGDFINSSVYFSNYYNRIFPFRVGERKKLRYSILMPSKWDSNYITTEIPLHLANFKGYTTFSDLPIRIILQEQWKNPQILGKSEVVLNQVSSDGTEMIYETTLDLDNLDPEDRFYFVTEAPFDDGIFFSFNDTDSSYQMVVLPEPTVEFDSMAPQKLLVLMDYDTTWGAKFSPEELVQQMKTELIDHLEPTDSFNLIFNSRSAKPIADNWLPASSELIQATFDELGDRPFYSSTNLLRLIKSGIQFVKEKGNGGEIILVSNNHEVGIAYSPQPELNEIMELMGEELVPFFILDYAYDIKNLTINGRKYWGNQIFYESLAQQTNGFVDVGMSYYRTGGGLPKIIELATSISHNLTTQVGPQVDGKPEPVHFGQTAETAYFYHLPGGGKLTFPHQTYYELGKYTGTWPLEVSAKSIVDGKEIQKEWLLSREEVFTGDSLNFKMEAGRLIMNRASWYVSGKSSQNNPVAIQADMFCGLTRTALLIGHPNLGNQICSGCTQNGGLVTSLENEIKDQSLLKIAAYPNPFSSEVTIQLQHQNRFDLQDFRVLIFDVKGNLIRNFHTNNLFDNGTDWNLTWDGKQDDGTLVSTGVYRVVFQHQNGINASTNLVFIQN